MNLFQHKKNNPYLKKIAGPFLTKSGNISGTGLFIETHILEIIGTEEEKKIFRRLIDENMIQAKEYLLKTTGAYDIWKEKIKELIITQKKLSEQTKELTKKETSLEETYKKMLETIKKTTAIQNKRENYYEELQTIIINNLKEEKEREEILKKEIEAMKKNILKGLETLEKEFPFFFKEKEIKKAA